MQNIQFWVYTIIKGILVAALIIMFSSPVQANIRTETNLDTNDLHNATYAVSRGEDKDFPNVVAQTQYSIKELPRTGLPLLALGLLGSLPGGLILRRFLRGKEYESANAVWNKKQLKS